MTAMAFLLASIATLALSVVYVVAMLAKRERGGGPLAMTAGGLLAASLVLDTVAGLML